jgi:hypothetical protein
MRISTRQLSFGCFAHAFRQHLTLGRNVLPPARLERRGV